MVLLNNQYWSLDYLTFLIYNIEPRRTHREKINIFQFGFELWDQR